jgi:hypothetical protein
MIAVTVLTLLPFHPFTFYGYENEPTDLCVGEPHTLDVDREVADGYGVYELRVVAKWIPVDDPERPITVGETPSPIGPEPRGVVTPLNTRVAPSTAGEYYPAAELRVKGFLFDYFPRTQTLDIEGDTAITVLPSSDPRCPRGAQTN